MTNPRELDGLWVVYGLVSGRAGWVFYVGMTSKLSRRLSSHRSCNPLNSTSATIREMQEDGSGFSHCVFGVFSCKEDAREVERRLIKASPELMNKQHNERA
jgi:hypothetical protein